MTRNLTDHPAGDSPCQLAIGLQSKNSHQEVPALSRWVQVDLVNGTNSQVASRQRPAERQAAPAELAVSGQWPTVLWPRPSLAACAALQLDQVSDASAALGAGNGWPVSLLPFEPSTLKDTMACEQTWAV